MVDEHILHEDDVKEVIDTEIAEHQSTPVSLAGVPVVRRFPFTFDTENLVFGHTVYIPTVDDVLLDAWIEVDTAWDGTTPKADVGSFQFPGSVGLFAGVGVSLNMTLMGFSSDDNPELSHSYLPRLSVLEQDNLHAVPARFLDTSPLKVVVTQDGTRGGADPVSTQGSAALYLVTATPA